MSRALTFVASRAIVVALVAAGGALTIAGALPAGAASAYSVTHATDPATGASTVVRWAPCTLTSTGAIKTHYITYRINTAGVPSRVRLVRDALAKVTAASGLHFRYLGKTTYIPHNAVLHYATGNRVVFDAAQESIACPEGSYAAGAVLTCTLDSPQGNGAFDVEVTTSGISIKVPNEAG